MFNDSGFSITIDKLELLDIVRGNRAEHEELYNTAIEVYREKMIQYLNDSIDTVKAGKTISHHINLPMPEEHLDDFDRVINMLEHHTGDEITIPEGLYRNYVDNDWSWSKAFLANTASYAGAAA